MRWPLGFGYLLSLSLSSTSVCGKEGARGVAYPNGYGVISTATLQMDNSVQDETEGKFEEGKLDEKHSPNNIQEQGTAPPSTHFPNCTQNATTDHDNEPLGIQKSHDRGNPSFLLCCNPNIILLVRHGRDLERPGDGEAGRQCRCLVRPGILAASLKCSTCGCSEPRRVMG